MQYKLQYKYDGKIQLTIEKIYHVSIISIIDRIKFNKTYQRNYKFSVMFKTYFKLIILNIYEIHKTYILK